MIDETPQQLAMEFERKLTSEDRKLRSTHEGKHAELLVQTDATGGEIKPVGERCRIVSTRAGQDANSEHGIACTLLIEFEDGLKTEVREEDVKLVVSKTDSQR